MAAESTKGKGVLAVSISPPAVERREDSSPAALSHTTLPARNASSKYDFVKVKVWLGDNADHYYVLSRFLLSRMLTVTKIPNHVAIKIALELKKLLIDNSLLDVSQSDLEANLFKLMERRGYGEEYINRYRMMTRFHHQRVPLVILVCGTACTGKSTIATQLAQRLNLPNVLQTDMVYELLRTSTDAPLASVPVWAREFDTPEELVTEFCRECRIVRKGLAGDLKKAMKDGKPIIIEGIHLDPSIYLMDEENRGSVNLLKTNKEANFVDHTSEDNVLRQAEQNAGTVGGSYSTSVHDEDKHNHETGSGRETSTQVTIEVDCSAIGGHEKAFDSPGDTVKERDSKLSSLVKKEKTTAEPIIVPIVLKMAEFDHKALLEEWISTRTFGEKSLAQDPNKLTSNLKTIQDYLCSFEAQGLMVVNISATTFPQTLDRLHSYLLQCIEQGVSTSSDENKHSEEN
uniref:2-phosphoglycerate kinase n=2 Tax=Anthurium amnicola TaxID=1678845 RepID=A0A1D1ZI04_9ARAE